MRQSLRSRSSACIGLTFLFACAVNACGNGLGVSAPQEGNPKPSIARFSATPATLPAGGGTVTLSWQVGQADSVDIDRDIGRVTGQSRDVTVTATTIFTLTATNAAGASTSSTAVVVGQNPSSMGGRFVAMVAPVAGESFTAPTTLRLVAAGHDPNVYNNSPRDGLGGNAAKVQFFVDDDVLLEVDGSQAEYWVFKGFVGNVAGGHRRVWARAIYVNPDLVLDSLPVLIDVADAPAYARTVSLDADVTVGGTGYELIGTPGGRVRVNGNGHRIASGSGTSAAITFQHVDFFDVGSRTATDSAGIDLTTSSGLVVEDCNFDSSNAVRFTIQGSAPASVKGNTFRSNMRQPLGQNPDGNGSPSFPAAVFQGMSTGTKVFQGNNGGAGWILFTTTQGWLIGGDGAADGNVLIGPRVGIYADRSQNLQIRRNYTHHIYYGGWSQGSNYELGGISTLTAEHNVIAGSSWPVRGVGGEFRYNLVLDAGHQWLWADHDGAFVHHNVFIGGEADVGGIYVLYGPKNVRIQNNTIDGLNGSAVTTALKLSAGDVSLTSNLFLNVPKSPVSVEGGALSADYNLFWNCAAPGYSDGRAPVHDVDKDPQLTDPASVTYDFDETMLWTRTLGVRDVLTQYRGKYTPKAGSPALDAGDPAGGTGNPIGAIGGGANPADQFGR